MSFFGPSEPGLFGEVLEDERGIVRLGGIGGIGQVAACVRD